MTDSHERGPTERRTIIVTGASDGIGAAAARELAGHGHEVVVVGRSPQKTEAIARELGAEHHLVDYAELASVRRLASELGSRHPRIDVLANNAGGIFGKNREVTADGHELTFQVNYLAPFLLTQLLHENLVAAHGTVINTSSAANKLFSRFDIDDLDAERRYSPRLAYGNAKLAQILHTKELDRRYRDVGLTSTAFHPGVIASSFSAAPGSAMRAVYASRLAKMFLSPVEKGADTLVFLAEGRPGIDYPTGEYFVDRKPAKPKKQATDAALARELWDRSVAMLATA
ncbi:SDR family NAD(P)-dependent oxidoreductase [Microbacterium rhizomatis]|uniref:SDR family NAD(P)-dependent oxidoreductase n=1 Tax=Microbacterium rhizomatis TaxID=1631477 RepID=A0A5J5IY91_9MICO|nr:SDR family NAD(P)-dependent oxidoreductase [Microbacterium rhizomatis]KAA9105032.1 SDR family NAD(P)-dependent oxidoreductase [Microbacterium rhizomatis]